MKRRQLKAYSFTSYSILIVSKQERRIKNMRSLVITSVAAIMLVLSACQPQDQGMEEPANNNTDLQRTRYGEEQQGNRDFRGNRDFNRNNENNFNNEMTNREDGRFNNRNQNDGGMNRNRTNEGLQGRDRANQNFQNYDVADRIADRITDEVNEVDQAYVLTGENNAYVAVVLDREDNRSRGDDDYEIGDDLKERISEVVKEGNRTVENVYVSANADFLQMVDSYVNDVQNGRPIQGFFEEFNNMIERIFPDLE